ncbi:MAG: HAD-IB family hydrolase, partial [Nitrospiraceae bacterium]
MTPPILNPQFPFNTGSHVGAFFDVDNTLVPGLAIEVRFFRHLLQRGLVGVGEAV